MGDLYFGQPTDKMKLNERSLKRLQTIGQVSPHLLSFAFCSWLLRSSDRPVPVLSGVRTL